MIDRNVFIASFFLTFVGEIGVFTQSLSFLLDHVKNVRRARILFLLAVPFLYFAIGTLVLLPITVITFALILSFFFVSYLKGTYEGMFTSLIYKGKLDEKEYITLSQVNQTRVVLGWALISVLSFLIGSYGEWVLSLYFIVGSIYYPVSHYFIVNFPVGERLNGSGIKVTKQAISAYSGLLKRNRKFFYVESVGVFLLPLVTEQSMYFYALFRDSPNLYQLYSVYNAVVMICYVISILTVRRVLERVEESFNLLSSLPFISIALYDLDFHIRSKYFANDLLPRTFNDQIQFVHHILLHEHDRLLVCSFRDPGIC
ncbi:hypothetical protein [Sulfuracidifex tepidarius]|uniref:Uncharacterized protein n=1 Tax=Sulfuracidifex tepidarius TaxID=1294262 RepID=A0A510E752_9CREN|nr:hypothetical protein [Sulfuracidifex tepidarius]BBG27920.1 hypothetical protein IC007_2475 [Sulfuracidifex tepidarius]